ncbi:MAG TPA: hypothetical protein VIF62_08375, partial [Labilithrix sp.]
MKAVRLAALATFALAALVSCSDLFDTAEQCTTDRDCEKFSAVCDVTHGVCVDRGAQDEGGTPPPPPPSTEGGSDAPVDPMCDVPNKPTATVGGSPTDGGLDGGPAFEITTSTTLDCSKNWLLKGRVFVRSGATLTIQAGTTIKGEKASGGELVIAAGAKIVASGLRDRPIVFTSDQSTPHAGDWGGLTVLGNAPPANGAVVNGDPALPYGGSTFDDASGVIGFVRIEYGVQGLVLAGVGNKTQVDAVMVRETGDNCFSLYGGTVDAKHLVCQWPGDELFEMNDGYSGRLQFLFGQNMPPGSTEQNGLLDSTLSAPTIYNATVCGSSKTDPNYGLVVRDTSKLTAANVIVTGWFAGIDMRGVIATPTPDLRSSIVFGNGTNPAYVEDAEVTDDTSPFFNDDNGFDEVGWFRDAARG